MQPSYLLTYVGRLVGGVIWSEATRLVQLSFSKRPTDVNRRQRGFLTCPPSISFSLSLSLLMSSLFLFLNQSLFLFLNQSLFLSLLMFSLSFSLCSCPLSLFQYLSADVLSLSDFVLICSLSLSHSLSVSVFLISLCHSLYFLSFCLLIVLFCFNSLSLFCILRLIVFYSQYFFFQFFQHKSSLINVSHYNLQSIASYQYCFSWFHFGQSARSQDMHIPLELFSPLSPSVNNTEKHVAVNCGLIWISNLMQRVNFPIFLWNIRSANSLSISTWVIEQSAFLLIH